MFLFATPSRIFHYIGVILFGLQLSLFVFCMPNFQYGIWTQTEPVMVALFSFTMLACIWLAIGVGRGWLEMQPLHPLWTALLLWVTWQLVATSMAPLPWRSWFGAPETGEGAGWYAAMLVLVALAYPLWQIGDYRRILIAVAAADIAVMAALQSFTFDAWRPLIWPDYLAFMAGYFWIIVTASGALTRRQFIVLAIFTVVLVAFSHSKAALPFFLLAVLASAVFEIVRRRPAQVFARGALMLLCLAPIAWIAMGMTQTPQNNNDHYGERVLFNRVGITAMRHEPLRWLTGAGWGHFGDDIFEFALVDGVTVYQHGERNPNWNMVDGHAFHTHDQPLEALLALGVPGLLLWFALPLVALRYLPAEYFWRVAPVIVALTALSFFWFELPLCMPFQALAWVALISLCAPVRHEEVRQAPNGLVALFLWSAVAFGWSAWQQYQAVSYGSRWYETERAESFVQHSTAELDEDIKRGAERLRASALNYGLWVSGRVEQKLAGTNEPGWYHLFLVSTGEAADSARIGSYASSAHLMLEYMVLLGMDSPSFDAVRSEVTKTIAHDVMQMTAKAPYREDIVAPFLSNLDSFTHNDVGMQTEILQDMLKIAPDHRSALWLLGQIYIKSPSLADEGTRMMKRAVQLGVDRVYPVPDEQLVPFH